MNLGGWNHDISKYQNTHWLKQNAEIRNLFEMLMLKSSNQLAVTYQHFHSWIFMDFNSTVSPPEKKCFPWKVCNKKHPKHPKRETVQVRRSRKTMNLGQGKYLEITSKMWIMWNPNFFPVLELTSYQSDGSLRICRESKNTKSADVLGCSTLYTCPNLCPDWCHLSMIW